MGNRVEKLEQQVAELRATVDGLTEELVETKERVNELEADEEPTTTTRTTDDEQTTATSHAEFVPNQSADDHAERLDTTADEPATDEPATDETTRTDDDDGDDIIVA